MPPRPTFRIHNRERDRLLADQAELARSFWARSSGLMGRTVLPPGYALIIYPETAHPYVSCASRSNVLFVGRDYRVVGMREAMPPNRPFAGVAPWRGHYVIEMPAGVDQCDRHQDRRPVGVDTASFVIEHIKDNCADRLDSMSYICRL